MNDNASPVLVIDRADLPPIVAEWLSGQTPGPLLVSIEPLADGQLVLQALPDVDPTLVARIRKIMAQYADVLRRLT